MTREKAAINRILTSSMRSGGGAGTRPTNINEEGNPMSNGSVLLIDASRLFREGLRRILSSSLLAAVHEACSVQDALPSIESLQPALVLVNFPDGGESQREAIGQIRAATPPTRIVVLTETVRVDRLS